MVEQNPSVSVTHLCNDLHLAKSVCLSDDCYLMMGISVLGEVEQNLLLSPEYRKSSFGRGMSP